MNYESERVRDFSDFLREWNIEMKVKNRQLREAKERIEEKRGELEETVYRIEERVEEGRALLEKYS